MELYAQSHSDQKQDLRAMSPSIITGWEEVRGGDQILQNKQLYQEIRSLASDISGLPHQERSDIFDQAGWQTDYCIHMGGSMPRFHAFRDGVAIVYIGGKKRARVRSDILCLERLSRVNKIDAGVLITKRESRAEIRWIYQDLHNGILEEFIFDIPLFIIETM